LNELFDGFELSWLFQKELRVWFTSHMSIRNHEGLRIPQKVISLSAPSLFFMKTIFPKNLRLFNINFMQKTNWKKLKTSKVKLENLILNHHLESIHHFWLIGQYISLGHVSGQHTNSLQQNECKNAAKSQSCAFLIFSRHLGHETPS
jgi:hypothetical protein